MKKINPISAKTKTARDVKKNKYLSWFYDFWLLVFHIITSCSALGVKELMLQFWVPVPEEKKNYVPRGLCIQKGDKTAGKVTRPSFFPFDLSCM